jgi:transcription factor C subunit 7
MPVTTVLLLRHGHRLAWTLDPTTGEYSSSHPYPTRLPADPPLAAYGVRQAQETGEFLERQLLDAARRDVLRIYSSLFYRCLETLRPTVERLRKALEHEGTSTRNQRRELLVRGERGLGEWFGRAWFKQPYPATPQRLKDFFPWVDDMYDSLLVPDENGERIDELHDRIALALERVVRDVDREYEQAGRAKEEVTIMICGHAAQIIAAGRALTGEVPDDYDEEDFNCFTCGISRFVRRSPTEQSEEGHAKDIEAVGWRTNGGVAGGWDCMQNSDCGHLSMGEERGWHFHGDESFDSYGPGMQNATVKVSDGGLSEVAEFRKGFRSLPKL